MNRIQASPSTISANPLPKSPQLAAGKFAAEHAEAPVSVFAPLHYERNYAYPLIIWLHGPHDDERQLRRIMPLISLRNYVAASPRGTVDYALASSAEKASAAGFGWSQDDAHLLAAESHVFAALKLAHRKFNVAPARVFLAGFACGGTMALRLALDHPDVFAGAASFAGAFPEGNRPLARIEEARKLKLMLATGRDGSDYPPEQVCRHLRLFHTAGMSVSLRQYPCGDDLTTTMLADLDRWIMEQVTTPTETTIATEQTDRRR
jgi:phospholipase/carboxylesterase